MAREYFKCFHSYFEKTKSLTDAEVGRLFRALMQYSASGEAPSLAGRESIAFDFIADEIKRDQDAYAQLCRQNAQNRAQRPSTTVNDRQREVTEHNETDKVEGIRKNIKEIPSNEGTKKSRAFQPPTLEEVKERCAEKGYTLDPEAFMSYYSANGWKVGRNKMVSWVDALAGWESREKQYRRPKQNAALKYEQKPINQTDFDALVVNLGEEDK
jgi:hypothetical protein